MFLQDPNLSDVDISPKEFLKRVEQTVKHKGANPFPSSSKSSMHSNATTNTTASEGAGVKLFDGTVTDGRQHPPTSIYAQQQFLPYSNHHPSSDYVPQQLNMRYHHPPPSNQQPVPRRMDSHESFHSYQLQEHQKKQQQQHYQQQQHSPLNTTPTTPNRTSSAMVPPAPSL